ARQPDHGRLRPRPTRPDPGRMDPLRRPHPGLPHDLHDSLISSALTHAIDRKICQLEDGRVAITYVDSPDRVRVALSPVRRDLLKRLRTPSSASRLAVELHVPRQRLNYHLKALEQAGLIELVEERQRRGCVERILRTRPGALVVDPT